MKYQVIKELMQKNMEAVFTEKKLRFSLFDAFNFQVEKQVGTTICTVCFDKIIASGGTQYPGGGMGLLFTEVEEIVFPLFIKHELWKEDFSIPPEKSPGTMGNYDITGDGVTRRMNLSRITISDKDDVKTYCEALTDYLLQYALPWFEEYSDLKNVNALINSLDDIESANWFSHPHMLRKLVIKKLNKDISFETYLNFWKNRFENARELENGRYIPYLNAVLDLEKQLVRL